VRHWRWPAAAAKRNYIDGLGVYFAGSKRLLTILKCAIGVAAKCYELSLSLSSRQFTSKRVCMTAGVPQGKDPNVRKDPQTLTYRDCLGTTGHPPRERKREWGQTRA